MKDQLEAFLTGGNPDAAAATVAPDAKDSPTGAIEAEANAARPDGARQQDTEDDDGASPVPLEGEEIVPKRAYEAERRRRQDWKERAARAEAVADELRQQVETAKRQPPAAAPQQQPAPPPPPIDVLNNPQGLVQRVQEVIAAERTQRQQELLNDRLNGSEERLREKVGDEKVDAYIKDFQTFAQRDPTLWGKLYSQANPYGWLSKEMERQRARHEIGDDPLAYKERLRAEFAAEMSGSNGAAARGNGTSRSLPQMSPSLARARSVAGRSEANFGPMSMDDILARGKLN